MKNEERAREREGEGRETDLSHIEPPRGRAGPSRAGPDSPSGRHRYNQTERDNRSGNSHNASGYRTANSEQRRRARGGGSAGGGGGGGLAAPSRPGSVARRRRAVVAVTWRRRRRGADDCGALVRRVCPSSTSSPSRACCHLLR